MLRHYRSERRKILPLALTTRNQHRSSSQPLQRGDGRADIGALGIIVVDDTADFRNALHAMRQPLEFAQRINQFMHRQIDRAAQRQRGQRVGRIVQPGYLQLAGLDQTLAALHQPDAARVPLDAKIALNPPRAVHTLPATHG